MIGTGAVLGVSFTTLAAVVPAASAAVPEFPNNVVVFPDRDFVSIEGYEGHAGETALVEVTRPGVGVVGSAKAVVSGTDVAFEVNHPGVDAVELDDRPEPVTGADDLEVTGLPLRSGSTASRGAPSWRSRRPVLAGSSSVTR